MKELRFLKDFSFHPELFVEPKKKHFISYDFLDVLIEPSNIETFESILNGLNFNYSSVLNGGVGFNNVLVNKNVSMLVANLLCDFLEKPEDSNNGSVLSLTDKLAISDNRVGATYSVLINAHARSKGFDYGLFVSFWNVKRMLKNDYFEDVVLSNANVFPVRSLDDYYVNYFLDEKNNKTDLIYSKLNLKLKSQDNIFDKKYFLKRKKTKVRHLSLSDILNKKVDIVNNEAVVVYKKLPGLEKRKKSGKILSLSEAKSYLRSLNQGTNNTFLNKDILRFVESDDGKKFLEHGGPITTSFLRYFNTNFDIVKDEYNK